MYIVLKFEPGNVTAQEFYPTIMERIRLGKLSLCCYLFCIVNTGMCVIVCNVLNVMCVCGLVYTAV